jgi:hypothetical protein
MVLKATVRNHAFNVAEAALLLGLDSNERVVSARLENGELLVQTTDGPTAEPVSSRLGYAPR